MNPAVVYLRRRTVVRAFHAYREWVGRAVGWWTILYLIGWIVVFVVAGLEALTPLAVPAGSPRTVLMVALALFFLGLALAGKVPPVILDRRDLHRLGVAPVEPWSALRWRFMVRAGGAAALGAVLGLLWTAIAPPLFGVSAPWAAPALALVFVARFSGSWLRYARSTEGVGYQGWVVALVGAGLAVVPYGLADALLSPSPVVLVAPALLAVLALTWARRSLAEYWPPRFASQSLVLTQLQAMRTMQLMAGVAGFVRQAAADGGEKRRLLAALHDTPGATKPRRSLPLVPANAPQWRAIAWRTATDLWRRPPLRMAFALLITLTAASAAILVNGGAAALGSAAGDAAGGVGGGGVPGGAGLLGGALGVLLAALLIARAGSVLLGPEFAVGVLPVEPAERTLGRVTPGALLFLVLAVPVVIYLGVGLGELLVAATLVLVVLLALEKYASWSGSGASRWEAQIVAAILAALPSLVLSAFGVPGWIVGAQVGMLLVLLLVPA
ncbi:MAG TPA: hypothetical protein PLU66_06435 [Trueperaceae bacterium]|nr:hypothetical protein [Trueperaceae bacterium]